MKSHCCNEPLTENKIGAKIEIDRNKWKETYFICSKCKKPYTTEKKPLDTNSDKSYNKGT